MTNKQFDENYLDRELDHLSREMVPLTTPNKVERAVMEAYLKKYRQRSSLFGVGNFGEWFAPGAAIVASVGISLWMTFGLLTTAPVANEATKIVNSQNEAPFIALLSLEQIALEPNPRLIETQVPKLMLAGMGIAVSPEMAGDTLRAEMLVSASGQPLALRFTP